MAKVISERKSKKDKIVAEVKPVAVPEVLHADHLLKIETSLRDIENAKLLAAVEEQNLNNLKLQFELLKVHIEKQSQVVQHCHQKFELSKQKFTNFKREVWPMYGLGIEQPLNYDPTTGNIKK